MKVLLSALALLGLLVLSLSSEAAPRHALGDSDFVAGQQVPFESISVYSDRAVVNMEGLKYAKVISNSMAPVITNTSTVLERAPTSAQEIKVNDIISFYEPSVDSMVLHLVTQVIERDGQVFYKTKGVANASEDPWEVPFENVEGIMVGVLR